MADMEAEDDYNSWQAPEGGYGDSQGSGTLYADANSPKAKAGASTGTTKGSTGGSGSPQPTARPVIHVRVNPGSGIKLAAFVDLIAKTPGIPAEFKGKIKLDTKSNTIVVPDFSGDKVVPGKEWLFDLGKAGSEWEISAARLSLSLDGPTASNFKEQLADGESRGYVIDPDPEVSLLKPSHDVQDIRRGLLLGMTIPTEAMVARNPPPPDQLPPPHVARLKSGKGLILIARDIVVEKNGKVTTKALPIPKAMIAMTFYHELSAHASFFQLGQDAAHSEPMNPAGNAVDRNAVQAESSYLALVAKDRAALGKKVQELIKGMHMTVP